MKFFIISLVLLTACNVDPPVDPHPTPVVTDTEWCVAAEKHLKQLNCPEAEPTKKGKSFTQFCQETQHNGIFLNPKCLAQVKSCQEIDCCTNTKNCKGK